MIIYIKEQAERSHYKRFITWLSFRKLNSHCKTPNLYPDKKKKKTSISSFKIILMKFTGIYFI